MMLKFSMVTIVTVVRLLGVVSTNTRWRQLLTNVSEIKLCMAFVFVLVQ